MASAGRVLPLPKGTYSSSTTYHLLDFVSYQGSTYICKQTSTGNAPTNTTYWQIMAQGTESASVAGNYYGTCSTEASTSAKIVSIPATENFVLQVGDIIGIKFDNTNTANNPTLNVNNSGAKPIYYNNSAVSTSNLWAGGETERITVFMYDGTNWVWIAHDIDNNTTYTPQKLGFGYGTCSTGASTSAKVVSLTDYTLVKNGMVSVKFTYNVPANATMNINGKGAKNIWYHGANITAGVIKASDLVSFVYDGTRYQIISIDRDGSLADLTDTQISSATDGQVLKYNSTSQKWVNGEDKGGILPHLIVISETGSTVTATKGQTVITATETSTGHFECDLTELGTWTIDAILGGDDAQVSLVVDTVKVYTVDDSHFHATVTVKYPDGATCRLQSADETLYATGSPYTFTVHHAETYTITVTYNQRIYTDTVTFTTEGQSFSKTLPTPSEIDVINDINLWLWYGDVSGTFSSLSEILANSTALSMLMSSTDAVDYLVRCINWISDICDNQSAMSYIGLNNYCANTLIADSDWLEGICNSTYFESVLNVKVPTMTSATTPSGEVGSNQSQALDYAPFKAFNGNNDTVWISASTTFPTWVYYKFTTAVKVVAYMILADRSHLSSFKIIASNDGTSWIDLTDTISYDASMVQKKGSINNQNTYLYYGISVLTSTQYQPGVNEAQFYGREDV